MTFLVDFRLPDLFERDYVQSWQLSIFIRHSTHDLFSDYRKRKVNFRNQRSRHHLAAGYTTIMSRSLKETGNRVMCDRGTRFLRIIMLSSRALCCLPSVRKQKHDIQVCFDIFFSLTYLLLFIFSTSFYSIFHIFSNA